jgi:hypothetical protein
MIVVESVRKLEIHEVIDVIDYPFKEDNNTARAIVVKEITEEEFIEFNRIHDPEFNESIYLYTISKPYHFYYLVSED